MQALALPQGITHAHADKLDIRKQPKKADDHNGHFLAIIAFDGRVMAATFDAVMKIQHRNRLWRGWKLHIGEGQVRSRNECADQFLKTPCTHMLFLDADVIPRAEHIQAMRQHPEAEDSIICGLYCKKQDRIEHPYNSLPGGNPMPNKLELMEIAKGPTGCMQIPRSALLKIQARFPERFYKCDYHIDEQGTRQTMYSFFFHDIRMDRELGFMRDQSEDWAFCEMAREAGVKIYADCSTTTWAKSEEPPLLHLGQAVYPLRPEIERRQVAEDLAEAREEIARLKQQISGVALVAPAK